MSIQLAGETASFSFSDCICDSPFTLESKLGRGISFVVVFLYFQTVKLNDYLLKATSTSSFNFPLICSVICWNLHFSKWLFVCYAFLVMFFFIVFIMISVGISALGSFCYRNHKTLPGFLAFDLHFLLQEGLGGHS